MYCSNHFQSLLYSSTSSHLLASHPDHIILHFYIAKNKIVAREQNSGIGLEPFLSEMFLHYYLMMMLLHYYCLCHHRRQVEPASLKSINNVDRIDILHIEAASSIGGSARSPKIVFDLVRRLLRDNVSMQAKLGIAQIPAVKEFKNKFFRIIVCANNFNTIDEEFVFVGVPLTQIDLKEVRLVTHQMPRPTRQRYQA